MYGGMGYRIIVGKLCKLRTIWKEGNCNWNTRSWQWKLCKTVGSGVGCTPRQRLFMIQSLAFADSSGHVVCCAVLHNPLNQWFSAGQALRLPRGGPHRHARGLRGSCIDLCFVRLCWVGPKHYNTSTRDPRAALPFGSSARRVGSP